MSLTSYQAAPPRVLNYGDLKRESKFEKRLRDALAPAVGFEPTTNRLTADRSTTELRWILTRGRLRGVYLAQSNMCGKRYFATKENAEFGLRTIDSNVTVSEI